MSEQARTIDTLLDERRTFAPSPEFLAKARVNDHSLWDAADADPEAFWAEQAKKYVSWYKPFDTVLEWDLPFAKWFVGRPDERLLQLPGPPRRGRQGREGRLSLRRRERRHPHDHLRRAALRRLPVRQRAQEARRQAGRPRRHLHADDPGAADGDAGLRADRGGALRRLRRLQRRGRSRPDERCRRGRDHHRRRGPAPRRPRARSSAASTRPARARRPSRTSWSSAAPATRCR